MVSFSFIMAIAGKKRKYIEERVKEIIFFYLYQKKYELSPLGDNTFFLIEILIFEGQKYFSNNNKTIIAIGKQTYSGVCIHHQNFSIVISSNLPDLYMF